MNAADIMTRKVVTTRPDTSVSAVARPLLNNKISSVPVVDDHDHVIGIISEGDLGKLSQLSPFELKNRLVALAASHADRMMLNAGRGNPNFLATAPRHAFFQHGLFAMAEAERCAGGMPEGVAGLPKAEGIAARFETFAQARRDMPGIAFLTTAVSYARDRLGVSDSAFLHELAQGVLGAITPSRFGC